MTGIRAVTIKELRQIGRDRRTLLILLFVPAFFLLVYGYALNFDIRHIRLAVQDLDHSAESRALVSAEIPRSAIWRRIRAPAAVVSCCSNHAAATSCTCSSVSRSAALAR